MILAILFPFVIRTFLPRVLHTISRSHFVSLGGIHKLRRQLTRQVGGAKNVNNMQNFPYKCKENIFVIGDRQVAINGQNLNILSERPLIQLILQVIYHVIAPIRQPIPAIVCQNADLMLCYTNANATGFHKPITTLWFGVKLVIKEWGIYDCQ